MEGVVKRLFPTSWSLIVILMLAVLLVACERPLQEEREATPTSEFAQPTMVPGGTATPLVSPAEEGYPAPGEGTSPAAGEGETPESGGELPGTPAATTASEVEAQPEEDVVHVVEAGETLGAIAEQYGVSVEEIAAANNLTNIHTLDVGQQLLIPLGGGEVATPEATAETAEPAAEEQEYIVQPGDNLYRIGLRYGFTIEELATYNNLANPNDLEVGQRILIPPEGYTVP